LAYLSVEGLEKTFPLSQSGEGAGDLCVFRGVDLKIDQGEFVTMIGHSGCGKSTLLNIIAGFENPTSGVVVLDGKEVTKPGLDRMVVFQSFALMPWLTAGDNVRLAVRAANRDWTAAQIEEHTRKYLSMMGLEGAADKRPAYLSGGMRQRVGLARAFSVQPKVMLLDEPFAQIDALTRGVIQEELIRMWNASGSTIFMVTHDVDEAILLSDRIALMSNGPEAEVAELLEVDIPRPRSREKMIDTPEYMQLRSRILHFLLARAKGGSTISP
jgi:nitrate/nitrite transport system ATP-binding protein